MKRSRLNTRGLRQILKIALRSNLRNLRQSILIVLIIAAPLSVSAAVVTVEKSNNPTPAERVELELGGAQASFRPQRPVALDQVRESLNQQFFQRPDSADLLGGASLSDQAAQVFLQDPRDLELVTGSWVTALESSVTVETKTGLGSMLLIEGDVWLLDSKYQLVEGRVPEKASEVLLSPAALDRVGASIGDLVQIEEQQPKLVVGVLESITAVDSASLVFAQAGALSGLMPENNLSETRFYLLSEAPVSWTNVLEFNRYGIGVLSAQVLLEPPASEQLPAELLSLMGLGQQDLVFSAILVFSNFFVLAVPIAVLSGAAFAFGARRQERTLALMSSLGASPKQLRQVTTFSAILLGLVGGTLGIGLGLLTAAIILPIQSQGSRLLYPGYHIPFFELGLLLLLATLTAYLVSLIPARNAARVDVVATLRGRRLGMPLSKRAKIGSLVVILLGIGLIFAGSWAADSNFISGPDSGTSGLIAWLAAQSLFAGIVLLIVGLMVGSGWLLELLRLLTVRGGIASRYAVKDMLFNRKRYQAVIAAVLAASFLGSSILVFAYGILRDGQENYRAQLPADQILIDPRPSMPELINPNGLLGQDRQVFVAAVERANSRLEQQLNVLVSAAEVENYSLIDLFVPLSHIGYGVDPVSYETELGADGMQPLVRIRPESLCPWNPSHPDYDEYLAIQESGNWEEAFEFSRSPEFEGCGESNWIRDQLFVGDASDLEVLLGERPSASAVATLESGGAIVFKQDFNFDGEVILDWYPSASLGYLSQPAVDYFDQEVAQGPIPKLDRSESLPATFVPTPYRNATIMISPDTAETLGIEPLFQLLIANFPAELSVQQRDFLNAEIGGYLIEEGFSPDPQQYGWLVVLIAATFVLAASSIALSLVQIESRPDLSALSSVGAPRVFRAKVVSLQALFLTVLGVVFGSIVGLLLGANLLSLLLVGGSELPVLQLAFLMVLTPILTSLLTFLVTPKAIPFSSRNSLD